MSYDCVCSLYPRVFNDSCVILDLFTSLVEELVSCSNFLVLLFNSIQMFNLIQLYYFVLINKVVYAVFQLAPSHFPEGNSH